MIKNILAKNYVTVNRQVHQPYISPGSQSAGMVRFNINSSELEVYDGIAWRPITSDVEIGLGSEVEMILDWAREKMLEDQRIDELCEKHPGLAKARDNYEMFKRLVDTERR
jgi:hypothetical protein